MYKSSKDFYIEDFASVKLKKEKKREKHVVKLELLRLKSIKLWTKKFHGFITDSDDRDYYKEKHVPGEELLL